MVDALPTGTDSTKWFYKALGYVHLITHAIIHDHALAVIFRIFENWKTMATVSEAILAVDPDGQWVLYGEPTNEQEFNSMYRRVIDTDLDGTAILS